MKKKLLSSFLVSFSVSALLISLLFASNTNLFSLSQADSNYAIRFDSSTNKFHSYTGNTAYDGTTTIKTNLGNDIEFEYYQIKGIAATWHVLGSDGYFYNTDPVHGIESIDLTFKTNDANYSIYYSRDRSFDHHIELSSSTSSNTLFNFDGYLPNYFKIINTSNSNLNISSITLRHSCLNTYPLLSISSNDETMGTVSGGGTKITGENVTITATPKAGYRFVGWYDDKSNLISSNASYSFLMGDDDLFYVARFTYESYNLVIESESLEKGSVSNSSGSYNYLTEITVSAEANDGYTFAGWYEGNSLVSSSNPYTFNMPHSNTTYIAKFSINNYNLTITNQNPTLGSVSGAGVHPYKTNVILSAHPNTGVSFLGWYDTNDNLISQLNPYSFSMPHEDLGIIAKFEWTPYSVALSVNDSSKGSVTGAGSYTYQQEVTLVATPNEHYSFFGWYDGVTLVSQESTLTFNMPNQSLNYEARFVNNHNLYIYSDDESRGTVSSPTEWGEGLEVTIIANAELGYAFDYWYDDDLNEVSYDSSYSFVMPNHDVTLYASFVSGYTLTVTSSDTSKGTVTGSGQYQAGTSVTVTMNYISGTFMGWFDADDTLVSKQNPYTFTMPASNYSLSARFMTQAEEEEEARKIALGIIPSVDLNNMTVTYGLYPQKNVNDSSLIASLNSLSTPESNGWYLYNNEYYAKSIAYPYNSKYKFDNGTTIVNGTTYWFKCEPIVWNILSNNNGSYYLLSSVLLDECRYAASSNNYKDSDIRSWLNNEFYNSAFALGNEYIQTTTVDNSASTTDSDNNPYACDNTQDKVFLPSYRDYLNNSYGFLDSTSSTDTRGCRTTDWDRAKCAYYYSNVDQSNRLYKGAYFTRSPTSEDSECVWGVFSDGDMNYFMPDGEYLSVRPSISIYIA